MESLLLAAGKCSAEQQCREPEATLAGGSRMSPVSTSSECSTGSTKALLSAVHRHQKCVRERKMEQGVARGNTPSSPSSS